MFDNPSLDTIHNEVKSTQDNIENYLENPQQNDFPVTNELYVIVSYLPDVVSYLGLNLEKYVLNCHSQLKAVADTIQRAKDTTGPAIRDFNLKKAVRQLETFLEEHLIPLHSQISSNYITVTEGSTQLSKSQFMFG